VTGKFENYCRTPIIFTGTFTVGSVSSYRFRTNTAGGLPCRRRHTPKIQRGFSRPFEIIFRAYRPRLVIVRSFVHCTYCATVTVRRRAESLFKHAVNTFRKRRRASNDDIYEIFTHTSRRLFWRSGDESEARSNFRVAVGKSRYEHFGSASCPGHRAITRRVNVTWLINYASYFG